MKLVKGIFNCLLALFVLAFAVVNPATAGAVEFGGVLGLGYDAGGEKLLTVIYTDGSTSEVKANQGMVLNAGMRMIAGEFSTQLTVGYKFGGAGAQNGSVDFDVIPLEIMEFYQFGSVRTGLGLSYHNTPTLKVNVPGSVLNGTYKFDNALGAIAQIGWVPADKVYPFSVDLRYTVIQYKSGNLANANEISGNVLGLYASYFF